MSVNRSPFAAPALICSLLLACAGCGGSNAQSEDAMGPADSTLPDSASCAALEQKISDELDLASQDPNIVGSPDYTIVLETGDGRTYTHSHGDAGPTVVYESASTSKLVTAVVIMDLVEQGVLSLDTKAHDLLPFWTDTTVTLRELLAFTSGYFRDPDCIDHGTADFEQCVEESTRATHRSRRRRERCSSTPAPTSRSLV